MKKVFVGILAVCLIICGLNMRADVDRLDPYSVTSEGGCVRADTHISAQTALSRLGGTVLWTEEFDGVTVTYAYSDFVRGYETVFYITAIYLSQCKIKRLRYAIPVALIATFTGCVVGCLLLRFI